MMIKKYWNGFLSLIYPNLCINCEVALVDGEKKVCLRCFRDFPLTNYHLANPNPLMQAVSGNSKIKGAYGFIKFNKAGIAQKLLHDLKYHGNTSIGIQLGEWFANHIKDDLSELQIDQVIPLPLHKSKRAKRGFNQSEIIARGIRNVTGINILNNVLIRKRATSTQTKKGKVERWQNVDDLYEIINKDKLEGKKVLLLDDVITTGATIGVAAESLAQSNVSEIYLGCIASGK